MRDMKKYLLSKIEIDEGTECWNWTGLLSDKGYAKINARKLHTTHGNRVSYMTFVGEIPNGLCVCHSCDNRKCINPAHLFLGTNHDNMKDMVKKGRSLKGKRWGEKNPGARFTNDQVIGFRNKYKILDDAGRKILMHNIAKKYNVCTVTVAKAIMGVSYVDATTPLAERSE